MPDLPSYARQHTRTVFGACLASLAALASAGCADHISRPALLAEIDAGNPPRIIDVRSASEYEESHVPGAIHVPFYSLLSHLEQVEVEAADGQPVVLYCEHGPRAGIARAQLWFAGVGPVLFMEGHMTAWKEDQLRVER